MQFIGETDERIELNSIQSFNYIKTENASSESLSIFWFKENSIQFVIDGKHHTFNKNQIIFLTEFHNIECASGGLINYLKFNRQFYCIKDHDKEVSCKGLLFFGASELPIIQIPDEQVEFFETLWKEFQSEMQTEDHLQIGMLQGLLKRYLILGARLYKVQNEIPKEKEESDIIRDFNFLVEQHYKTIHSVGKYAEMMHKSPKTLSNLFSKQSGKTPLQHIQNRILLEARRLLYYSDLSIKEIGYELGYNDIQAFSRFFKKHEGISASDYRNKAKERITEPS